jgi:UDP-N-acetylmuramoylalanine--D-glutamate ligase
MQAEWEGCAPITMAGSLEQAIDNVHRAAVSGDVVVFSPGCSSFDMFRNFEHRGEVFKGLVKRLNAEGVQNHA